MRTLLFIIFIIIITPFVQSQDRCNVKFKITDITITDSPVFIAVYDNEDGFNNKKKPIASTKVIAKKEFVEFNVSELEKGEYAVAIFQDINENGKLDSGMLKIPKEPFGISNYTSGLMFGAPTFNKAKIKINGDTTVSIPLISFIKPDKKPKETP